MNKKINQIIDIKTPNPYYEDEELIFYALLENEELEIKVKNIEQLYRIAPSIGFSSLEVKEWFLEQAKKCVQNSFIHKWFLSNASKCSESKFIN